MAGAYGSFITKVCGKVFANVCPHALPWHSHHFPLPQPFFHCYRFILRVSRVVVNTFVIHVAPLHGTDVPFE